MVLNFIKILLIFCYSFISILLSDYYLTRRSEQKNIKNYPILIILSWVILLWETDVDLKPKTRKKKVDKFILKQL